MFSKILIANRGEIAIRIIRALSEMGIKSVAVYSNADKNSLHRYLADESICIGSEDASDSYLRADRIISAALLTGAKAIHPGYGFLSENEDFASLCEENGIAFIGPGSALMRKLSDKTKMKEIAKETHGESLVASSIHSHQEIQAFFHSILNSTTQVHCSTGVTVLISSCTDGFRRWM